MTSERIGVTGHQDLPQAAEELVADTIARFPPDASSVTVVCSLARGADTLVAEHLMSRGAQLHVIVPAAGYEETFEGPDRTRYESLLRASKSHEVLAFQTPSEEAYMAAGERVARSCDWLIAVWDGEGARGLGGTGDVVALARRLGKRVRVIWPDGVNR